MNHAEHYGHLASLADAQRENARLLAGAVAEASADGLPWRLIGEALGIAKETAFRQHKAGSPVSVLRPFLSAESPRAALTPALLVRHADGTVTSHVPARHAPLFENPGEALALNMDAFCSRRQGPHEAVAETEERP